MIRFRDYLGYDRPSLLLRLCDLSEELATVYSELGLTRAEEFSTRADAWLSPREDSITGRTNDVRYAAATQTISTLELEMREKSLLVERDLLLLLISRAD